MWFIVGIVITIIVMAFFVRGGEIEDEEIKEHNRRVHGIESKYDRCQFGLKDKYKDSTFHPPRDNTKY